MFSNVNFSIINFSLPTLASLFIVFFSLRKVEILFSFERWKISSVSSSNSSTALIRNSG